MIENRWSFAIACEPPGMDQAVDPALARSAHDMQRANPWITAGVVALAGLGCGDRAPAQADEGQAEAPPVQDETHLPPPERTETASSPGLPLEAMPMAEQLERVDALGLWDGRGDVPPGIDPVIWSLTVPEDNEVAADRIALGRKLYFDTRLSADGTIACATCHDVSRSFVDHRNGAQGIRDQIGRRNSPTTMNAMLLETLFWDGRAQTLEEQAEMPILNPIEMGQPSREAAVASISADPEYAPMFQAAYGRAPNYEDIGRAIASFERTLTFLDAPFDRFIAGDPEAMSADAKAGWVLFNERGRCNGCHPVSPANLLFTDHRFHNIGVAARHQDFEGLARRALQALARDDSEQAIDAMVLDTDASELGRFVISHDYGDIGAFRTPQLRNVGITAPYMHDGSMATLWDVMDHYNKGGEANAHLDGGMVPLALDEAELGQLVAFMFALTDVRFSEKNAAELQRQRAISEQRRPFRDDDLAQRRTLAVAPGAPGNDQGEP